MTSEPSTTSEDQTLSQLPPEILVEIVKCADDKQLNYLKLVNWTFYNAVNARIWRVVEIYLKCSFAVIKNTAHQYQLSNVHDLSGLANCLERVSGDVKDVTFASDERSATSENVAQIFAVLFSKVINLERCRILLPIWSGETIEEFKKHLSRYMECSVIRGRSDSVWFNVVQAMDESVTAMIEAFSPSPIDEGLEIRMKSPTSIDAIPISLLLTYGDAIKSLSLCIGGSKSLGINRWLEFCANLEWLHLYTENKWEWPAGAELHVPKSVMYLSCECSDSAALTVFAPDIKDFSIDCKVHRASVQLKFSSLGMLTLSNCAEATAEQLDMFVQMGSWSTLKLDTIDYAELLRLKPVIERATDKLYISELISSFEPPQFDTISRDWYAQWLSEMSDSISQLSVMTMQFPLLPPETLKQFIVESVYPALPNLVRLQFTERVWYGGYANLKRRYPFLSGDFDYYIDRSAIEELSETI